MDPEILRGLLSHISYFSHIFSVRDVLILCFLFAYFKKKWFALLEKG